MKIKISFFVIWSHFQGLLAQSCNKPCLYVATVECVMRMSLNQTSYLVTNTPEFVTIPSKDTQIRALELDLKNGYLYWGNLMKNEIIQLSLNKSSEKKLFHYAIGYPIGLAVDWTSNVLYWVDSLMKLIETSTTEGQYRKVLFKLKGDAEPRGIVVHPAYGYLFWTDWGVLAKIERASLSGTNRIALVSSGIVWPNDLAIDFNNNILYWVDAYLDVLGSINVNGSNKKTTLKLNYEAFPHPFSLAFFEGKMYVSDWTDDSIYLLHSVLDSITQSEKIFQLNSTLKINPSRNIGQLRIFTEQSEIQSPCSSNLSNCSHLCFTLSLIDFSCGCPTGMMLSSDNLTCIDAEKHFEIFFADSGEKSLYHLVKYINQDGFTIKPLVIPVVSEMLGYPVAIDYDEVAGKIYWTDTQTQKTYRMKINESEEEIIINHQDHASTGLAIDKVSRLMFFFEKVGANNYSLVVSDMDGKKEKSLLLNLKDPQDIEYYDGYVFYSDVGSQIIGRINSDGSGLLTLPGSVMVPLKATGLAIDSIEKRLYWCDQERHLIESSDFNFLQRRNIIQKTYYFRSSFWLVTDLGQVLDPFDLTIHQENIFWTDLKRQAIFVADKRSGDNIEYVTGGLNEPRGIFVTGDMFHEDLRRVYTFSFNTNTKNTQYANCFMDSFCSSTSMKSFNVPDLCPVGYKETNYGYSCSNCSDAFGANFKCLCTDWKTCAQRGYANIYGCRPQRPFLEFIVRECTQVVKPGFCPYRIGGECSTDLKSCSSDEDCNSSSKCCESACGFKCVPYLLTNDHPCTMNNGGCSHLCFSSSKWHKCGCPDGMKLKQDGKECENISKTTFLPSDVCALRSEHGPCQPFNFITKWYFNSLTKSCEEFLYGGCEGNRNKFDTKMECQATCGGVCPYTMSVGTCVFKPNSCISNSTCPGKQLCCLQGCAMECLDPTLCAADLCKNGGSCFVKNETTKCSCVDDWFGSTCQLNTKPQLVTVLFETSSEVSKELIITTLANSYSRYCSSEENLCAYDAQKRRRRSLFEKFNEDNIYISKFEYLNNRLSMVFAIVSDTNGVMTKESIEAGLSSFSESLERDLQVKAVNLSYLKTDQSSKKSNSPIVAALVCLFVVVTILIFLFAFLRYKRRPGQPGTGVHWSFGNQLYTDIYPHDVSLSTETSPNSLSYTNPMYSASNFDENVDKTTNDYIHGDKDYKLRPQQWVQFTDEKDEVLEKPPITEFVSPYDDFQSDMKQDMAVYSSQENTTTYLSSYPINNEKFLNYVNSSSQLSDEHVVLPRPAKYVGPRSIEVTPLDATLSNREKEGASDC